MNGEITKNRFGIQMSVVGSRRLNFRFLTGDVNFTEYGGSFVSRRFNNGDFDYWLVIDLTNQHEQDESLPKYFVAVNAVSPQAAGEKELDAALDSSGLPDELRDKPLFQVEALHSYGTYAQLATFEGDNWQQLMKAARLECRFINSFFGFYMDRPRNAFGATGWDVIAGNLYGDLQRFFKGE